MVEITTIIPTYRRPEKLKKAIQTVLDQTYPHFKVCVYDNGSGDETAAVVSAFADRRIHYFCHPRNIDAAPNFEYGMREVQTPFFSFLSDDDLLLPDFYANALRGFEEFPQAAFSAGRVIDMAENGSVITISKKIEKERELRMPLDGLFELIADYINWTGIVFRKEVIDFLDEEVKPFDVDFVLRCAARFPYVVSQKKHAIFMHHSTSYSGNCGLKLVWPSWLKILENLKKVVPPENHAQVEILMRTRMGELLTSIGTQSILKQRETEVMAIADLLDVPLKSFKAKAMKKVICFYKKYPSVRSLLSRLIKTAYALYRKFR